MFGFFDTIYYGNTLSQWLIALLLIVLFFIIGKAVYWVSNRWIKSLTSKTQTQIDDLIIDMIEEPIVVLITLIGIRYSLATLHISASLVRWIDTIFQFGMTLLVAWLLIRLYDAFHTEYFVKLVEKTETDLDDQLLPILRTGLKFTVISLAILIGLNNAGYNVGAILAGLGIGGLAIALAAQDTVANLFGGIIVFLHRPFKTGDRIRVGGVEGYVREVGLRSSLVETVHGEKVLLPNKVFGSEAISNLDVAIYYYQAEIFHIHRNTTLEQIEAVLPILKEVIDQNEHIVWSEPILATVGEYSFDIQIDYGVKMWQPGQPFAHHLHKLGVVKSQINQAALKVFENRAIKLSLPVLLFSDQMVISDNGTFAR
ncbi:MAG: mechanosensitive ion channel [Anaerolineaceae bacterium]|nr:mechanosensitive ion channel [Anaerolineaceae bacterium]MCB9097924.1 mechanosensitive ion channel [Anaerolineales bacterium]